MELVKLEERDFAFQNRLQTFSIVNNGHIDVKSFLDDAYVLFEKRIEKLLEEHYIVKVAFCFMEVFEKEIMTSEGAQVITQQFYLHTRVEMIDFETFLSSFYTANVVDFVQQKIDDMQLLGSGFRLAEITELNVQVSRYDPFGGSSYIKLPKHLEKKKAIINVQNKDNQCFKYAILSALFKPDSNAQRVSQYKQYENVLNFADIKFPVQLKDISKFESYNSTISVNVYMYDKKALVVRPLRLTKSVKLNHIHLLLLTDASGDDEEEESVAHHLDGAVDERKMHYCWIKNLSALISRQISKNCTQKLFCDRCLNYFTCSERLNAHTKNCFQQNDYQVEVPLMTELKFANYNNKMKVPFVIYADLESLLKVPEVEFCQKETTKAYQQHEAYAIGYYFKCNYDDSKSFYRSNRGPNCIDWFIQDLQDIASDVEQILNDKMPLNMSLEDEAFFIVSDECHICEEPYMMGDIRVRDHCHLTGKYRGSAHSRCNLGFKVPRYIPVIFHNLAHYDAHFIISALATKVPGNISIIPRNEQNYVSFTKTMQSTITNDYREFIKFRFIDSFQFMAKSLDYLSSTLPFEKKSNLKSQFNDLDEERLKMLKRKGVFCYDYIDEWGKLEETSLPSKEMFYSKLNECELSVEDYEFACKIWSDFKLNTLGEYSDLYMKTDILLLADIFENFRVTCYENFSLDPAHYYTAPGLTFDSMLKYTKVEIELMTDVDMLLFIEKGIRGGISQCSKRHAKANNKYMEEYDPNNQSKYIVYLDANNLYGYAMMQSLPINNFAWCQKSFTVEEILSMSDDSEVGYIFEVDLQYPQHLHDSHKDYPFCAESRSAPNTAKAEKKLMLTLFDKKNYIIHYKMLKGAIQQGLRLKKVHRVLEFKQSKWLQPYINLNTALRTKATNEFEKDFYKLMINAIYGKTMENVRTKSDIRLKSEWNGRHGARKLVSMPNFKKYTIFNADLVAIHMDKTNVILDKPIAIGMSILEISKVLMYEFFYNHLRAQYGDDIKLLYTDTDSFILEVDTDDFYADMINNLSKFDTSDFPENNAYNIPRVNKKVPGMFKDELNGEIATEYAGLGSKMYGLLTHGVEKMKKAKGVKKYVLKKNIKFQDYIDCINDKCNKIVREQNTFRSKKHTVFSVRQKKVALSGEDNKRFILEDNVETLPWGHYLIPM
ncbi:uncharacterized protein LOC129575903 [Sitodiplosis mosellana]|uniref:uncharacterized protein LOC129575903 n=1 Tax=Sitodiplosis mosellana TaxID=263140 RepID=UPI002444D087|nr:uncharacterized protein LOC129575903 [Sitodiplosis mosellana]